MENLQIQVGVMETII